jgi:hypothetical protein
MVCRGTALLTYYDHNGCGAHPLYPIDTKGSLAGGKAAESEADHSPPTKWQG